MRRRRAAQAGSHSSAVGRIAATILCVLALGAVGQRPAAAASVTLTWTAPGDNGLQGRATGYQVRLTAAAPGGDTLAWWNAASAVAGSGVPRTVGNAETLVVSGLPAGADRFFAVRVLDEVGNLSPISNVARATVQPDSSGPPPDPGSPPDTIAPELDSVAVLAVTHSSATIVWVTDEKTDARVAFGIGGNLSLSSSLDTVLALTHTMMLSGLRSDTTYAFQPVSRDSAGNAGVAGPLSFRTLVAPDTTPPVVGALSVTSVSESGARFAWETSEPAKAWVEHGPTSAYGDSASAGDTLATRHEAILAGLASETTYHARVVAVDKSGNRAETVDLAFTTSPDAVVVADSIAPTISAVLALAESINRVRVSWATDEPSVGEIVYRPLGEAGSAYAADSSSATNHEVVLAGLAPQTRFTFSVVARDTAGNLAVAGPLEFETPSSIDRTPPIVSEVAAEPTSPRTAVVRWRTDEPTDTQVEYGLTATLGLATPLDDSLRIEHAVSLAGLEPAVTYVFRVLSRDGSGNLTRSPEESFSTPDPPPSASDSVPPAIASVEAVVLGPSSVSIRWSTNEPADAQVAYGPGSDRMSLSARDPRLALAHEILLDGLQDETSWSFTVLSADSAGNRAESEPSSFETPSAADTTRPTITGLAAHSVTSTSVEIQWTTDEPADRQVEYGETDAYGHATPLDEDFALSHAVRIAGLSPATGYHVRVLSRDSAGNLSRSADLAFETAPLGGAPGDTIAPHSSALAFESIDPNRVRVLWTTDEPSDGQVEYGLAETYGTLSRAEGEFRTSHEVVLVGLAPGTVFHCRSHSRDSEGNVGLSADAAFETDVDKTPPAALPALSAEAELGGLRLVWDASEAEDLAGYRVYRSFGDGFEPLMAELIPDTTIVDQVGSGLASAEIRYAVAAVDRSGNESAWIVASVSVGFDLLPARPNPANPGTQLRFRLPPVEEGAEHRVLLAIYDLQGSLVRTLIDRRLPGGEHDAAWDGGDWRGNPVASGIYFARLATELGVSVRKLTVLR